jgi:hypothetical protein
MLLPKSNESRYQHIRESLRISLGLRSPPRVPSQRIDFGHVAPYFIEVSTYYGAMRGDGMDSSLVGNMPSHSPS